MPSAGFPYAESTLSTKHSALVDLLRERFHPGLTMSDVLDMSTLSRQETLDGLEALIVSGILDVSTNKGLDPDTEPNPHEGHAVRVVPVRRAADEARALSRAARSRSRLDGSGSARARSGDRPCRRDQAHTDSGAFAAVEASQSTRIASIARRALPVSSSIRVSSPCSTWVTTTVTHRSS